MSNKVNVSTTANKVTITPQENTGVSIGTTNTPITVNQGSTSVVQIQAPGVKGNTGPTGPIGPQGPAQDTGSLLTTASYSNPNLTLTKGDGSTFNVGISTTTPTLAEVTAQGSSTTTAITASIISASGDIVATNVTASGDISSSGDLYGKNIILPDTSKIGWATTNAANNIYFSGKSGILTIFSGSTFTPASVPKIQIDVSNASLTSSGNITANIISASRFEGGGIDGRNTTVKFTAPLTASIISASGNITANNITASGNISSSGTVRGSNVTATNATDITSLKTKTPFLFTLQTSSTQGPTIFSESIAGFTPDGTIGGGTVGVLYFSSQSANGVKMTGADPSRNPTDSGQYFEDVGSQITLISTSSGKFVRIKVAEVTSKVQQFQYNFLQGIMITGSGGYPDQGDTVEMIWDNSAGVGTIQGTGVTNADPTINKIEIAYRTSSGIYAPNIAAQFGDESPVSAASTIYAIPFISKSADLIINSITASNISSSNITLKQNGTIKDITGNSELKFSSTAISADTAVANFTVSTRTNFLGNANVGINPPTVSTVAPEKLTVGGNISASGNFTLEGNITASNNITASGTGSFGYMFLPNLPTSDPGIAGAVFRTGNDLKISTG